MLQQRAQKVCFGNIANIWILHIVAKTNERREGSESSFQIINALVFLNSACYYICCFQSMATAVAQLYMALPNSPSNWSLQHTGVVSFVKDNPQRSYYIRMFDLKVTRSWHVGLLRWKLSEWHSEYHCTSNKWINERGLGNYRSHVACCRLAPSSPGWEAGVGAGALQPVRLFIAAALLPHICCWCKFHFRYSRWFVGLKLLFAWNGILFCVSATCRIAKLDSTLRSKQKQKLFKMPLMRKSARDKVDTVSEISMLILNV